MIRASEKLRRQGQRAGAITVFTRTSLFITTPYNQVASTKLDLPTNDTGTLLSIALGLSEQIFKSHCPLIKAGVLMQQLQNDDLLQNHLFVNNNTEEHKKRSQLIRTIRKQQERLNL